MLTHFSIFTSLSHSTLSPFNYTIIQLYEWRTDGINTINMQQMINETLITFN